MLGWAARRGTSNGFRATLFRAAPVVGSASTGIGFISLFVRADHIGFATSDGAQPAVAHRAFGAGWGHVAARRRSG